MHPIVRFIKIYWTYLVFFLTPIIFLPLPLLLTSKISYCGYIIILMAVYWSTEIIPLGITSLIPIVLVPFFGIMTARNVALQYMTNTNMFFIGGLLVAMAIEEWHLNKRIALKVLLFFGVKPARLTMGLMVVTAFLSMWFSDTATTTMMIPIANSVLEQLGMSKDKFDQTIEQEINTKRTLNQQPDEMPTLETFPDPEQAASQTRNINKLVTLCICYSANIGGTATLTGAAPNLVMVGHLYQLFPDNAGDITFSSWFVYSFPNMLIVLLVCWIWLQIYFLGVDFKKNWGCGSLQTWREIAGYQVIREEYKKLGKMSFAETLVVILYITLVLLWLTRNPGFMPGWSLIIFGKSNSYISDGTTVIFIAFLMCILPSTRPRWESLLKDESSSEQQLHGKRKDHRSSTLLDWDVVQHKLPWNVVMLLGGSFALSKASQASGLVNWVSDQLEPLKNVEPQWAIVIVLMSLVCLVTELTSDNATATIFLPVLASLALSMKINPLYVIIPATIVTSFGFMLPSGTAANALVFSYGHLTVMDMVKVGLIMKLLGLFCVALTINTWGQHLFNLNTFPTWANISSA